MDFLEPLQTVWDYLGMHQAPEQADVIVGFGNFNTNIARRAAELYRQGLAPVVLFTGGLGRNTEGLLPEPEAVRFARVAMECGVPETAILLEPESTNTAENILFTRRLLDGLYEREAKATFFLCGYRMQQYPELTQRIYQEGHEIGLHGFTHNSMASMGRREIAKELMDTQALLPENCRVRFFRPPGGCCSDGVRQVAQARNLAILNWSVDPRDWATSDTASIEKSVLDHVSDGDIILLHDMTDSSVDAALDIVDKLQSQGFRFATVSQLAAMRGYRLQPGKVYTHFPRKKTRSTEP